jgi:hypothetical protein
MPLSSTLIKPNTTLWSGYWLAKYDLNRDSVCDRRWRAGIGVEHYTVKHRTTESYYYSGWPYDHYSWATFTLNDKVTQIAGAIALSAAVDLSVGGSVRFTSQEPAYVSIYTEPPHDQTVKATIYDLGFLLRVPVLHRHEGPERKSVPLVRLSAGFDLGQIGPDAQVYWYKVSPDAEFRYGLSAELLLSGLSLTVAVEQNRSQVDHPPVQMGAQLGLWEAFQVRFGYSDIRSTQNRTSGQERCWGVSVSASGVVSWVTEKKCRLPFDIRGSVSSVFSTRFYRDDTLTSWNLQLEI